MPFWRGLVTGILTSVGLAGIGFFYLQNQGITVAIDRAAVAAAIGQQVETQAQSFLPAMLASLREQGASQIGGQVGKVLGTMEIDFGSARIPLPPQVTTQLDGYVATSVQATMDTYLAGLDIKQLAARMGRLARNSTGQILNHQLAGRTFIFHPYPGVEIPVHVVMAQKAGSSGTWSVLSDPTSWVYDNPVRK